MAESDRTEAELCPSIGCTLFLDEHQGVDSLPADRPEHRVWHWDELALVSWPGPDSRSLSSLIEDLEGPPQISQHGRERSHG
jgi:hypothetical protein